MAEPPEPPSDDDKPRASFTDDDRDFPLPHENRSWITGRKRKVTVLRVDPDTLPKSETNPEPTPEPPLSDPEPEEPSTRKGGIDLDELSKGLNLPLVIDQKTINSLPSIFPAPPRPETREEGMSRIFAESLKQTGIKPEQLLPQQKELEQASAGIPKQEATQGEKWLLLGAGLGDVILAMIGGTQPKFWVALVMLIVACGIQLGLIFKIQPFRARKSNALLGVAVIAVLTLLWWGARPERPIIERRAEVTLDENFKVYGLEQIAQGTPQDIRLTYTLSNSGDVTAWTTEVMFKVEIANRFYLDKEFALTYAQPNARTEDNFETRRDKPFQSRPFIVPVSRDSALHESVRLTQDEAKATLSPCHAPLDFDPSCNKYLFVYGYIKYIDRFTDKEHPYIFPFAYLYNFEVDDSGKAFVPYRHVGQHELWDSDLVKARFKG